MQIPAERKTHSIGFFYKALPFPHLFLVSYLSALNILNVPSDYPFLGDNISGRLYRNIHEVGWRISREVIFFCMVSENISVTTFLRGLSSKCLVKVQYKERELRISFVILIS